MRFLGRTIEVIAAADQNFAALDKIPDEKKL
jgi:hypothetical protein